MCAGILHVVEIVWFESRLTGGECLQLSVLQTVQPRMCAGGRRSGVLTPAHASWVPAAKQRATKDAVRTLSVPYSVHPNSVYSALRKHGLGGGSET